MAAVGLGGDCGLVGGRGRWVSAWCCVLGVAVTLVVCAAPARAATSRTAYVVNELSGSVTPIDTATNTPGAAIAVGSIPMRLAITPDGKTAYVANFSSGSVTPIDTATNTPGAAIPVGTDPFGVAITPDGKTAYVTNVGSDSVTPIDTATNTPGAAIPVGSHSGRGRDHPGRQDRLRHQRGLGLGDADRHRDQHAGPGDPGRHRPDRGRDHPGRQDRLRRQPGLGHGDADRHRDQHAGRGDPGRQLSRSRVAITPDGKTAYVANEVSDSVTPIDTATNTPGATIPVGSVPFGVAITPDGKTAYVTNADSNSVTPIDTATNTPGTAIPVGNFPVRDRDHPGPGAAGGVLGDGRAGGAGVEL